MKRETAARVAEMLSSEYEVDVDAVKGRLGELSVSVDDCPVYAANLFWYPTPKTVLAQVRNAIQMANSRH